MVLIHLNGVTAIGKSTVADRLVAKRPLALKLDIDSIRVSLGQWREHEASKQVARTLGFMLAARHLASGRDVVVPQLLVRPDVIDQLEVVASEAGASFVEVMLVGDHEEVVKRMRASYRRREEGHPRDLFSLEELESQLEYARPALERLAADRPATRIVDVSGLSEAAAALAVEAVLGD